VIKGADFALPENDIIFQLRANYDVKSGEVLVEANEALF